MMEAKLNPRDYAALQRAIARNPRKVADETGKFLKRGIAAYMRTINRSPWRVGGMGGGAPRDTGALRESHNPPIYKKWEARIEPNRTGVAPYAVYVHEGTKKMEERPWLDYARDKNENEIQKLQENLLTKIRDDLAK